MVEAILYDKSKKVYRVKNKQWPVGDKYTIHEHIGNGSYGDVCKSTNKETNEVVALKRIPDILCCPMLAKRVLREVCIMRRLSHPNIIRLCDVFTRKSHEANNAVDLYIATEFADGGDMYHLQKLLTPDDVKNLVFQLLSATQYLHSCQVWHRDIKSENTLLFSNNIVKLCDFGLSRSAYMADSDVYENQNIPNIYRKDHQVSNMRKLKRQYTKTVVTPSYRAPEVVMSKGQYTSAIDIWSVGCIFWELLMRQMNTRRLGPPAHPLFGVKGEFKTPLKGEKYDGDNPISEHLDVIFDVIGTPCWKDIESVPSEAWRAFLKKLPGRSGNLHRQMINCGDADAIDLLSRMLSFNPERRCTAEEAMHHAYFRAVNKNSPLFRSNSEGSSIQPSLPNNCHFWEVHDPAIALGLLEKELESSTKEKDGGKRLLQRLLQHEIDGQNMQNTLRRQIFSSPSSNPPPQFPLNSNLMTNPPQMPINYFSSEMQSSDPNIYMNPAFFAPGTYSSVRNIPMLPSSHLPPQSMVFYPRPSVPEIVHLKLNMNQSSGGKNLQSDQENVGITSVANYHPTFPEPGSEIGLTVDTGKRRRVSSSSSGRGRGRGRGGGRGRGRGKASLNEVNFSRETIILQDSPEEIVKTVGDSNHRVLNILTDEEEKNDYDSNKLSSVNYGDDMAGPSQTDFGNSFPNSNSSYPEDPAQLNALNPDMFLVNTFDLVDQNQDLGSNSIQNGIIAEQKPEKNQSFEGRLQRSFSIRDPNSGINDYSFAKNMLHQNLILEPSSPRRSPRLLSMRQNDSAQKRKSNLMN